MDSSTTNHFFTKFFLALIGITITILGIILIINMLSGVDTFFQYLDRYFHPESNYFSNSSNSDSVSLLTNIKLYIWISVFYVVVFWLSLVSLLLLIWAILQKDDMYGIEDLLKILGSILIGFGVVTFGLYLSYSDNLNNIEWMREFRGLIGFSFLFFNCFHGFICLGVANIHADSFESIAKLRIWKLKYEKLQENSDLEVITKKHNQDDMDQAIPTRFCTNCGMTNASNGDFCEECGTKL